MVIYIDGLAPTKAHDDDAAFDIRAESSAILSPGSCRLVPSGFAIAIPEGHVGLICSRSGLAINNGVFVLNAPGVIDPGYRDDVGVILMNLSPWEFQIETGDRIAQLTRAALSTCGRSGRMGSGTIGWSSTSRAIRSPRSLQLTAGCWMHWVPAALRTPP